MLGRVPIGSERQRDRKRRACDVEHNSKGKRRLKIGEAEGPKGGKSGDDDGCMMTPVSRGLR
jgi:hypothetical protein